MTTKAISHFQADHILTRFVFPPLYVGKVKKNFYSRIVQHLGYFKTAATQGLQLCHWGNNLSLKLKLHVIEFNRDMEDMMPAIEQHFAQVLKPLVGKHI